MRPKCECVYFAKLQLKVALSQVGVAADPHLPTLPNQALAEHLGLQSFGTHMQGDSLALKHFALFALRLWQRKYYSATLEFIL